MKEIIIKAGYEDTTLQIIEVLQNCSDGAVIKFSSGEYHFWPEFAFEKYYYISNNRHSLKRVAFPVIGKKNVVIDGGGSKFIFHGEIIPFVVEQSSNITLKNFSIDWQRMFYSEGMVLDADASGVTVEIDPARYPYRIENSALMFEGEGWESPLTEGIFEMDSVTRGPAYMSGDSLGLGFPETLKVEYAGAGRIRLVESFPHLPKSGNILIFRHFHRWCPGIHLKLSKDTLLENVTVFHAGGMGVIGQFCENVTMRDCQIKPADGRILSVTVDATHFVNCRGQIIVDNCQFEGQLDDPCNVHGINTRIKKVVDCRTLLVELVHCEQHGVEIGFSGDRVHLVDNQTLLSYAENRIRNVTWINSQYSLITFENDLPDFVQPKHAVENMSWTPDLLIQNSICRNNRARGYLISTPGKVIIENNRIESSGAGIKISGDANYWFESGAVRDVLIRNNEFGDCCYGIPEWGRAVIDINPEIAVPEKNPECFHRNIRIENNQFFSFDTGILFARSVDGIRFAGNTIRRTESYPPLGRMRAMLTFEACRNIDVADNNVNGSLRGEWMQELNCVEEEALV
ncbi:MAG: right-handed parallel beta-helix repeat-containing protein [Kiritimatiellales bacterium]